MANKLKYDEEISKVTKKYLEDALIECQKCWDVNMKDKCSYNCDKDYILYQRGKRVLKSKLSTCLQNTENNQKTLNNCYAASFKDILSLQNFIKRVRSSEENMNS